MVRIYYKHEISQLLLFRMFYMNLHLLQFMIQ